MIVLRKKLFCKNNYFAKATILAVWKSVPGYGFRAVPVRELRLYPHFIPCSASAAYLLCFKTPDRVVQSFEGFFALALNIFGSVGNCPFSGGVIDAQHVDKVSLEAVGI